MLISGTIVTVAKHTNKKKIIKGAPASENEKNILN
jgi:hypothetical protein